MTSSFRSSTDPTALLPLVLYGKPGCCLCDDARPLLASLAVEFGLEWQYLSILDDASLYAAFRYRIPVVRWGDAVLDEGRLDEATLRRQLQHHLTESRATANRAAPG